MTTNTTKSEESTEQDTDHQLTARQLIDRLNVRAIQFETLTETTPNDDEAWQMVTLENTERTDTDTLTDRYRPVRNVTELVSVEDVEKVFNDAR